MNKEPKTKYVKRANMWVVVHDEKGKQKQSWFSTKEDAEDFVKELHQENEN